MDIYSEREDLESIMLNMDDWESMVFRTVCPRLAEKKIKFENYIKDLFRPFRECGKQQNRFEWRCIKGIYNVIKNDVNRIWSLKICCAYILELFCEFNCDDHRLIRRVICMYHQVLDEYDHGIFFLALCGNCMRLNNPRHYYFEELQGTSSILSKINRPTERIHRFTNNKLYSKLTMTALNEGDYVFLKFLVKHGLSYFPEDELAEAKFHFQRLKYAYQRFKSLEENIEGNFIEPSLVIQQFITDEDNPNIRRLILIIRYINICLRRRFNDNYYLDYVKCLNLYVLTLPEAAISVTDVEDFLDLVFPDDRTFITEMCRTFEDVFSGYPSVTSPRFLQHLCRCTLRDSIQKCSLLPSVLSKIYIPGKIKEYLLISSG